MSIPDPDNKIKNFLDTSPDAYQRASSHISEFQNDPNAVGTHRGIDAYGRTKNTNEMLPNNMKTVMYGTMQQSEKLRMGENRLWLKMEPHGAWAFSPKVRDPNGPQRAANAHDGKAAVGHTLGAAGAIEAVASLLALHQGFLPPTVNHRRAEDGFGLDYIPGEARAARVDAVLSANFAFGGNNAVLVFGRCA